MAQSQKPPDITAIIKRLSEKAVYVGIPQEEDPRSGSRSRLGNASLGYIHEHGSPARNIPARPFLAPGIREANDDISMFLGQAATAAMQGNEPAVNAALARAGTVAVNSVQAVIQAGIPPPLKQSSVNRRRNRGTGSSYRRKALTPADVTPLIDTGALLRSITYVVRNK